LGRRCVVDMRYKRQLGRTCRSY